MTGTDELPLKLPEPEVSAAEIAQLTRVLFAAGGWLTAREILAQLNWAQAEHVMRKIRLIASAAAPAVVSYPGSPGYKLWSLCTVEEINHCIEAFESQGKDMLKRAVAYRQAYHQRFRGAPPA